MVFDRVLHRNAPNGARAPSALLNHSAILRPSSHAVRRTRCPPTGYALPPFSLSLNPLPKLSQIRLGSPRRMTLRVCTQPRTRPQQGFTAGTCYRSKNASRGCDGVDDLRKGLSQVSILRVDGQVQTQVDLQIETLCDLLSAARGI